jgi:transglutaminase-like putative cysteine protease
MQIKAGYEISVRCPAPTPLVGLLSVHPSRAHDVVRTTGIVTNQAAPLQSFLDAFGNVCTRTTAPEGVLTLSTDFVIEAEPSPDASDSSANEVAVDQLPDAVVQYLLGSRYCETDKLSPVAWSLFGSTPRGYQRVRAIFGYVQEHVAFGYEHASATRSAWGTYHERRGVFRDFVHLAVAFCRCMNIPARYCTGYLVDERNAESDYPVDFSPWFEAYLAGRWHVFDPRPGALRTGRVLMAAGRDAADVPIYTTFGPSELVGFRVFADAV